MRQDGNYPLISIIIPVFNTEIYLGICLHSVINQTYPNLEIIVVNDGSTDNCPNICEMFAMSDSRIKVFHQPNRGVNSARNKGLKAAKGEYIGFVDSDDWVEKDMYLSLYETIKQYNADIAACPYFHETSGTYELSCMIDRVVEYNRRKALHELYENGTIRNCLYDKLFKRHLFDEVYFPDDYHHADTEILCMLLFRMGRLVVHPHPQYHYRIHAESLSQKQDQLTRDYHQFRALDYQYRFLNDNGFLLKRQPKFIKQGLRLLDRLKNVSEMEEKETISQDITQRLSYYSKFPVRELGILNAFFLNMAFNHIKSRKRQTVP